MPIDTCVQWPTGNVSAHFSAREFQCRHCGTLVLHPLLVLGLEWLRHLVEQPIYVTSGYRCEEYNRQIGGAPDSQHVLGKAADIRLHGMDVLPLFRAAYRVPYFDGGGIGLYSEGFVHVDVRDGRARWGRVQGIYGTLADTLRAMGAPTHE